MKKMLIWILFPGIVKAQVIMNALPSYWGMHITHQHRSNIEGFAYNPAQLAVLENSGAAILHCVPFNMTTYRQTMFAVATGFKHNGGGFIWGRETVPGWSENRMGLAYGRDLGVVQMGLQFNYYERHAIGYSTRRVVYPDFGIRTQFNKKLCVGLVLQNLAGGRFWGNKLENVATLFRVIAGYQFSDLLHAELQVQKTVGALSDWKIGLQYNPMDAFEFKLGFAHASYNPYLEIGWYMQHWVLAVGGEHHLQLGMSYGISMRKIVFRSKSFSNLANSLL